MAYCNIALLQYCNITFKLPGHFQNFYVRFTYRTIAILRSSCQVIFTPPASCCIISLLQYDDQLRWCLLACTWNPGSKIFQSSSRQKGNNSHSVEKGFELYQNRANPYKKDMVFYKL